MNSQFRLATCQVLNSERLPIEQGSSGHSLAPQVSHPSATIRTTVCRRQSPGRKPKPFVKVSSWPMEEGRGNTVSI